MYEQKKFNTGEQLYNDTFYFVDHALLVDAKCQDRIKEFIFSKKFSIPPCPSIDQTNPTIIDDFLIIENEYSDYIAKKQKENKNA
tara:strand:+ start:293 stop:547 length:255 start_codon:yes stop_codon:yes gene_type:complete